jgi:glucosyltransferase
MIVDMSKPLVSVITIAYNQEKYIEQALKSIVEQDVTFSVELLVGDDASTDRTPAIIEEYAQKHPNLVRAFIRKKNLGADANYFNLLEKTTGKYIAVCEGDDYWTDPNKLQKQVDFMEKHSECGLLFTDLDFLNNETGRIDTAVYKNQIINRPKNFAEHLITAGYIAPCTWLFRRSDAKRLLSWNNNSADGSFVIALDFFANKKIRFLNCATAVYRVHNNSITHSIDKKVWREGVAKTQVKYIKKYPETFLKEVKRKTDEDGIRINYLESSVNVKESMIADKDRRLTENSRQISAIVNSKAYKIGHIITAPYRLIKNLIHIS